MNNSVKTIWFPENNSLLHFEYLIVINAVLIVVACCSKKMPTLP